MKRELFAVGCWLLLIPSLVFAHTEHREAWECPESFEGQTLTVANWPDYFAEDTLPNFAEACGVTIQYEVYFSNEILLETLRAGNAGYDVVVPTGYAVTTMIREGLLQPLDHDRIRNGGDVRFDMLNPDYDPGNVYTLPYQWGTIAVAYHTEKVTEALTSWEQVWAHEGPVAWIEDRRMMFGVALILLGHDPNTEDAEQIAAASAYLQERSGNVVALATDDFRDLLANGAVDITLAYDGDILSLIDQCECDTYAYALMEEATGLWIDNMAIPSDAPNPGLAMAFIDYILHPQVGADISNATAYASPNQAALRHRMIDKELRQDNPGYAEENEDVHFFSIVELSAAQEQQYNEAWEALLQAIGLAE